MRLNDLPEGCRLYGDASYRGDCPPESNEQVTFFAWLRRAHPKLAEVAIHPRNEGKRHYAQTQRHKSEGLNPGASDIIIPASASFVCELKRRDHTKSRWQPGQEPYLEASNALGAFTCLALGWEAAADAVEDWLATI
jgi:hypothetical protein